MLKALSTLKSRRLASDRTVPDHRRTRFWTRSLDTNRMLAHKIVGMSDALIGESDQQLLTQSRQLKAQVINSESLAPLMAEAYALVREASRRSHHQAHYEVQLLAGLGLFAGGIAEMQTGEGKTLAALLPAYLYSLVGKGCHVVTANDYLAKRDSKFATEVFQRLGVSVGCLFDGLPRNKRRNEYDQDITYGTAREFGFDFLKDRLACLDPARPIHTSDCRSPTSVQRGHFYALVDEADSVMIDDARTPLLIASPCEAGQSAQAMIGACHQISLRLKSQTDFELHNDRRTASLTKVGCLCVLKLCQPNLIHAFGSDEIYEQVERSLCANYLFQCNRHYVVDDGEVAIVDESTGRIADGRKWQDGLHQAVEAKEQVAITGGTQTMAKVTVQSYFRKYRHLAGLTGTAQQVAYEFKKVYELKVSRIPTRKPSRRTGGPERIFARYDDKSQAIAMETRQRIIAGQAVLIGTPSVGSSQRISEALLESGIKHHVLNCLEHEAESKIIAEAGLPGRVTVATNMAGRGTDIHVDESVLRNGGLHVIATARHSSSRIDRQLIGRTARQGQPGSYQFFLSLEDELFSIAGEQPKQLSARDTASQLGPGWCKIFDQAQAKIEKLHERQRFRLLEHEKNRNKLCVQMGLDPCLEMLDE